MSFKNVRDSYKLYKESTDNPVDSKTYIAYANEYNRFLVSKVLEGYEVTLPMKSGTLSIVGRKQKMKIGDDGKIKGLAPDWVSTKKLWDSNPEAKERKQLLYHTNEHTDNVIYKFLWSKKRMITENKILYALRMTRENKRSSNSLFKEGKQFKTKI